ncbi:unnamed protein product [Lactuca saligna]|uniref:Glutathione S-transferase T3-like n=1 Tax=Lactuca saligna TaxID=75948 RepID=A0AA35Z4V5_LACSI|nr:unnamed protein product [Lactuca saligna]
MAPQMHQFNLYASQPIHFYQNQSQTIPRPNLDLDPFETVQETQFFSQAQPQSNFQCQPHRLLNESTDSSDEGPVEESFQELQAKGKRKNPSKGKAQCKGWIGDEDTALVQAWLHVPEDPVTENDQNSTTFKARVWHNFWHRTKRQYYNPDQLYSKWRIANKATMEFNNIYMNAIRNAQSGANEVDVLENFCNIYKAKVGKPFGNEAF